MLQNNALTGLLFLVGIFYNSWILGLGAIFGNIVSTLIALFFKYPQEDIRDGLYGFNGTLVGIAIWFFFGVNVVTILGILVGASLSTFAMRAMKTMPAYTAPFVLSTWAVMLGITLFDLTPFLTSSLKYSDSLDLFSATSMGIGQVMFQENIVTGLFFLLGILINSRTVAVFALYGSLIGGLVALLLPVPLAMISLGLFGYNGALCGIAFSDLKDPLRNHIAFQNALFRAVTFATFAIIFSVFLNFGFNRIGMVSLTAPFVLATWIARANV